MIRSVESVFRSVLPNPDPWWKQTALLKQTRYMKASTQPCASLSALSAPTGVVTFPSSSLINPPRVRSTMPQDELEINMVEYSSMGGEMKEMVGQTPALVVECLVFLLKKRRLLVY